MPDPKEFFEWMKRRNVKVTVNEHYEPLTRESDSNFDTIRKAMGLPEDTKQIPHDIANKKYAGLFMDLLHKPALDMGMAFWWQDGCAPTSMKGLDPYLWTRHLEYNGSERITGRRTTAFCRLGKAVGSHRYGIYFTGDLIGIWESLPLVIPATIRGGNQLMPYMNNLCCGVHVVDLPAGALPALGAVQRLQPRDLVPRPLGTANALGIRRRRARKPIASSSACATRCSPTSIPIPASPTTPGCRWSAECISTIPSRKRPTPAINSTCSAGSCSWRR